jgi:8-oxo-dGTP pyrophosphatase MutT (NUDIX family)
MKMQMRSRVYGSIVFSSRGQVLLVQGKTTGKWSFPKGHKNDPDETALECAMRETWEETGLTLADNFLEIIQLAAGKYFVYRLEEDPMLMTYDKKEIMDMCWADLSALEKFNANCDIRSYIMRGHMARHKDDLALLNKMKNLML